MTGYATPTGVEFFAITAAGDTVAITEDVAALYDLVVGSMDYGSDFLTVEDAIPLARMCDIAGFTDPRAEWAARTRRPTIIQQARAQVAAAAAAEITE